MSGQRPKRATYVSNSIVVKSLSLTPDRYWPPATATHNGTNMTAAVTELVTATLSGFDIAFTSPTGISARYTVSALC